MILESAVERYSCYAGSVLPEVHETNPELAADCAASISRTGRRWKPTSPLLSVPKPKKPLNSPPITGSIAYREWGGSKRAARASLRYLEQFLVMRLEENVK